MDTVDDKNRAASIDYENPQEVADLMAKHLGKIFRAIFKQKMEQEIEKLKQRRKGEQLKLF